MKTILSYIGLLTVLYAICYLCGAVVAWVSCPDPDRVAFPEKEKKKRPGKKLLPPDMCREG